MFDHILVVCTGNICRSPMAKVLLRSLLSHVKPSAVIESAGTTALIRHPADEPARALMHARGLDLDDHRARQINSDLIRWAELILVMEHHQRDSIFALDPTARGKTYLLGHWTGTEIPDPYERGEEAYLQALNMIDVALATWTEKIAPARR